MSLLDGLLGGPRYHTIQVDGVAQPQRKILNLTGATGVTDDPGNGATKWDVASLNPALSGSLIQVHEEYASTVAHYRCQDTASDADALVDSKAGLNLTHDQAGNAITTGISPGSFQFSRVGGFNFLYPEARLRHNNIGTALKLTGAMTAVMLVMNPHGINTSSTLICYGATGENDQYMLTMLATQELQYSHQHTSGTTVLHKWKHYPTPGPVCWLGFTRTAGGVVQLWFNGKKSGPASSALTMPTAGPNTKFYLGADNGGGFSLVLFMASIRLDNVVLSDDTLKADYNRTLGRMHGYVI